MINESQKCDYCNEQFHHSEVQEFDEKIVCKKCSDENNFGLEFEVDDNFKENHFMVILE